VSDTGSPRSVDEVRELIGLHCWAAELPQGGGISLQLGGIEPIEGGRGATMGTHQFSSYYARWVFRTADAHTFSDASDPEEVRDALPALEAQVSDVRLDTTKVEIIFRFVGGAELVVRPDPEDGPAAEAWIVVLPGHRCVSGYGDAVERGDSRDAPGTRYDA
jgi:hypothetical protein